MINCHACGATLFRSQAALISFDDAHMFWLCIICLGFDSCGHWFDDKDNDCVVCKED